MNEICVKEVIVSTLSTKGLGKALSPIRRITQVFEKDGTLIAENDPYDGDKFMQGDLVNFARWLIASGNGSPTYSDVEKWLCEIAPETYKNQDHG